MTICPALHRTLQDYKFITTTLQCAAIYIAIPSTPVLPVRLAGWDGVVGVAVHGQADCMRQQIIVLPQAQHSESSADHSFLQFVSSFRFAAHRFYRV